MAALFVGEHAALLLVDPARLFVGRDPYLDEPCLQALDLCCRLLVILPQLRKILLVSGFCLGPCTLELLELGPQLLLLGDCSSLGFGKRRPELLELCGQLLVLALESGELLLMSRLC